LAGFTSSQNGATLPLGVVTKKPGIAAGLFSFSF
jgi:hypothetical protein